MTFLNYVCVLFFKAKSIIFIVELLVIYNSFRAEYIIEIDQYCTLSLHFSSLLVSGLYVNFTRFVFCITILASNATLVCSKLEFWNNFLTLNFAFWHSCHHIVSQFRYHMSLQSRNEMSLPLIVNFLRGPEFGIARLIS